MSPAVVNIAAYKFVQLTDLAPLREELRHLAKAQLLRGTILLSPEGINLFVAGSRQGIDLLLDRVKRIDGLADIAVKESYSDARPFSRMLVKIKREIIAFGVEGIEPQRYTSRRLAARELKRWLDAGKPVTLLDTRNDFEMEVGTFKNALAIGVDDFRDFPRAVERLPGEFKERLKNQPIVTFCTGGIRCEKAAPFLERAGFTDVYQLDGGILKYFEEVGGSHYRGSCFVFDERVALDAELKQTGLAQCFACQAVLTSLDQASADYVVGKSCPHCAQNAQEKYARLIEARHLAIARLTATLPGSVPYDNFRPLSVPLRFDRLELLDFLDAMRTHLSREQWIQICNDGQLTCRNETVHPGRIMRAGERLLHKMSTTVEPEVARDIRILHEDDAIVVVSKPAPLPMHPCGRFNRNTLLYLLNLVYHPAAVRPAHRLDADTTGVVVFTKSRHIARILQPQFERGDVNKSYLARVHGKPQSEYFECHAPLSESDIRVPIDDGAPSSTRFRFVKSFYDDTSLLEVTPLSGRTNQIRAHLWELSLPIVGDPIYLRDHRLREDSTLYNTLPAGEPPLCLHAAAIEFMHPLTKSRVRYESAAPIWAEQKATSDPQGICISS